MRSHKLILLSLVVLSFFSVRADAQAPRTLSYQGVLSQSGSPVSGTHDIHISIYDAATGGVILYEEYQKADVRNGLFNLIIGSVTPIPTSLAFDRQYYLGIGIDGGAELTPRVLLTASPYAMVAHHAELADGLTPGAHGVVTSINELAGPLQIVGDSVTTITQDGSVIGIHAKPGSGGIKSIDNTDKTIDILNGTGPNVTIGVANNGISTAKLADGAVTPFKINQAGATNGQVLKWNGITWVPSDEKTNTYTAGQGISISNNVISNTAATIAAGTTLNSTLRWNGSAWTENTNMLSDAAGNTQINGATTLGSGSGADNVTMNPGTGFVRISTFGSGIVKSSSNGQLSSGLVDLNTDVTGILPVPKGGTGVNNIPAGQILIGNGVLPVTTASILPGMGIDIAVATGSLTINNTEYGKDWRLTGNAAIDPALNFLGTTDANPLAFRTNSLERARFDATGNFGIGTNAPIQKVELKDGNLLLSNSGTAGDLMIAAPGSAKVTSFTTQNQANDIHYILPGTMGTPGQSLAISSVAGTTANLDWITATGGGTGWALTGNTGTTAGTNYLGTTDNQPFEIHVFDNDGASKGSKRVLRIEPNATSANLIGGYSGNSAAAGTTTVTIAGGGKSGSPNAVSATEGTIGGGDGNTIAATATGAVISGGLSNNANGVNSSISGGYQNTASDNSAIPGGVKMTLGTYDFGFNADLTTNAVTDLSGVSHVAYFGNTDLWLGNVDNTARALRFYGANSNHSFTGALYSSFEAGSQLATIKYTLPTAQPTLNQMLTATAISGTGPYNVTLSWTTAAGGGSGWALTGNSGTTAGTNYLGTIDNQPFEIHVFDNDGASKGSKRVWRIEPNSTSANIIGGYSGNSAAAGTTTVTIGGGGKLGATNSVNATEGTIAGGDGNSIASGGTGAVISGGLSNNANGPNSTISGGDQNTASDNSAIPGGVKLTLGTYDFGFNADLTTNAVTDLSGFSHVAYLGNTDLWLGNVDNSARSLRFYGANSSHNYTGALYSSFAAGTQAATLRYTLPTTKPTINQMLTATAISGAGPYDITLDWTTPAGGGGSGWGLTGNAGTTPGTNYLGTTDNQAFEIHVFNSDGANKGSRRVLRIEPNATSANIIGGYSGNSAGVGHVGSVIAGGGLNGDLNTTSGNYDVVVGGRGSTNTASQYGAILGGFENEVSGDYSTLGGGQSHKLDGSYGFIGGGIQNIISSSIGGAITGGDENEVNADQGFVGGGNYNREDGYLGAIAGGINNMITSTTSGFIGGGSGNLVAGIYSAMAGGNTNNVQGDESFLGGGEYNTAYSNYSTVGGGANNWVNGDYGTIVGGHSIYAGGTAAVASGAFLRLMGNNSFGFNAGTGATDSVSISTSNIAYFGNVNMWLGNTKNSSSQLRFYGPQNGGVTFPGGSTHYSSFQAATQASDINYTLPGASPVATGNLLLATTGAASTMSWSTGMVWDNTNSRLGVNINTPLHPVHSVNASSIDEIAAIFGNVTSSTANQAIGIWGDASNVSTSNTGSIGVLATGNGNSTAGQTNVALQVNDGEFTMGRTAQAPGAGSTVAPATGGTAYSAEGPSGVIEFTLGAAGNLTTAAPVASTIQDLGAVTINNRYCESGSIVLVNVVGFTDIGVAPKPEDAAFIVNADNTNSGSFTIRVKMIPTASNASNYTTSDKVRIGYIIVNKSK